MPPETVAALYDAHAPALYRFLISLSGSEADTRDLLQDLFIKLVRQPLSTLVDPQAYLFRAARNGFADLVRRNSRRRGAMTDYENHLEPPSLVPPDSAASAPSPLVIARALAGLPEEQRAVVHLKIWENLTFARIAEILGIPANTAASRYRYAMDHLRKTGDDWRLEAVGREAEGRGAGHFYHADHGCLALQIHKKPASHVCSVWPVPVDDFGWTISGVES